MDHIVKSTSNNIKPHALFMSWPIQGHFVPMMNLARLLHHRGFHITFANTEFSHNRLLRQYGPDSLNSLPSFQFLAFPSGADFKKFGREQPYSNVEHWLPILIDLISKLNSDDDTNRPPVTCIVSDPMISFTLDAAQHFGIPIVYHWMASACSLVAFSSYLHLVEKGLIPIKDPNSLTNGYLDTVVEGIPGFEGIQLKNFPHFVRTIQKPDESIEKSPVPAQVQLISRVQSASAIVLNTFDHLDQASINAVSSSSRLSVYAIGPTHQLVDTITDQTLTSISSIGSNLYFKEDMECLHWLDSKDPNSVIYVSIGSLLMLTSQQLVELAWGLANSNKNFLWVVRPDLVIGEDSILPSDFETETRERGLMTSWCPQEQVLGHKSIAGFLTHCGWNSMMESVSAGVPMICWPFSADQPTSSWYCCNKWGIGVEMEGEVSRDKVEKLVVELMDSDKGRDMKVKAMELKRKAEEAVGAKGSSQLNLDRLIKEVLIL